MDNSRPLWLDTPYSSRPPWYGNDQTDIVIIGGGITGISAAMHLSAMGYPPIVLERNSVAAGTSGRNAGFIIAGSVEFYHRAIGFIGHEKAKRLWQLSLDSHQQLRQWITENDLDCEYHQNGSLVLATTPEEWLELQEAAEKLQQDGFSAELAEQTDLNQWGAPLQNFLGGYFCQDDGEVNPAACIRELATVAETKNAKIYENTTVTSLRETRENTVIVTTPDGEIETKMVLLATNAYLPQLENILDSKIIPVRGQMMATAAPKDFEQLISVPCYANFGYDYFRQLPDGRLIVGGSRDHQTRQELGYEEQPSQEIQDTLDRYLTELIGKTVPRVTHRWAGIMGFARDGLPIVGRLPYAKQIYVAGGFTGHGMSLAVTVAEIVSTLLIEGKHPDFSMFSIRRFLK